MQVDLVRCVKGPNGVRCLAFDRHAPLRGSGLLDGRCHVGMAQGSCLDPLGVSSFGTTVTEGVLMVIGG
jgi:hypothetical protein